MTDFQKDFIGLINSALNGTVAEVSDDFDWNHAYNCAKSHQITPLLYYGITNSKLTIPAEIKSKFENATMQNIVLNQNQMYFLKVLFATFEKEDISYMPLKGTLLKKVYPKPEMRAMSDADILIKEDEYSKIRPVMEALGYTERYESDHELVWKKGVLTVELHKSIIPTYHKDYFNYFGNGWKLASEKIGKFGYKMKHEDELIYNFTHLAKHYRAGGIGIKHITDVYVCFPKDKKLDYDYIESELRALKLWDFFSNILDTVKVWFGTKEATEKTDFITDYIFSSGAYGTSENQNIGEALKTAQNVGGSKNVMKSRRLSLIFPPYKTMCKRNPIVKKYPLLLPVMWVVRWFEVLIFKRNKIDKVMKNLNEMTRENIDTFEKSLEYVGLTFNFEEK